MNDIGRKRDEDRDRIESEPRLLRDYDDQSFAARYGCDRFTAALLVNRFRYTPTHMSSKLQANAFSVIIRENGDLCAALCGPPELNWAMPAVSQANPLHWGPMADAVRSSVDYFGIENLEPGDVLIVNDCHHVGTHTHDVMFLKPLFVGGKLVSVLAMRAHQLDWGGRTPYGFDVSGTSLGEDGLVFPPTLLFRGGKPVRGTIDLIAMNTRLANVVLPDITSAIRALELGEELVFETIGKYGLDAYFGAMRYACDSGAESMRLALTRIPDGDYYGEEILEHDGLVNSPEYVIKLHVKKCGTQMEFDFSGSSHASRSALNCAGVDTKSTVIFVLKMLLDRHTPYSSGAQRGIDLILPPGSILNATYPSATMYYWELILAVSGAIFKAFNPVLGEDAVAPDGWSYAVHTVAGMTEEGATWFGGGLTSPFPWIPWGGTRCGDSDGNAVSLFMNTTDYGSEPVEADHPVVILRRQLMMDTAGPGYNRGGAATIGDAYWFHGGDHIAFQTRVIRPCEGVNGGRPGTMGGGWIFDPQVTGEPGNRFLATDLSGEIYRKATAITGLIDPMTNEISRDGEYIYERRVIHGPPGSILRFIGNGAGGWGNSFTREPDRVLHDVRDEYVSIEGAARDYGVVIVGNPGEDPEGLRIDVEATAKLRGVPT